MSLTHNLRLPDEPMMILIAEQPGSIKAVGCYDRRGQAAARLSLTWAARAASISIALNATRAANEQIAGCIFDQGLACVPWRPRTKSLRQPVFAAKRGLPRGR